MSRTIMALGVSLLVNGAVLLINDNAAWCQQAGSWRPSPPNSKAIVYDEKGRRLYWDNNGQIVGRYSFATGRYIAELPGKQREEKIERAPKSPGASQRNLAIVFWGRGRGDSVELRGRPKIIQGPTVTPPALRYGVVRYGIETPRSADVADRRTPPSEFTTLSEPLQMP